MATACARLIVFGLTNISSIISLSLACMHSLLRVRLMTPLLIVRILPGSAGLLIAMNFDRLLFTHIPIVAHPHHDTCNSIKKVAAALLAETPHT